MYDLTAVFKLPIPLLFHKMTATEILTLILIANLQKHPRALYQCFVRCYYICK